MTNTDYEINYLRNDINDIKHRITRMEATLFCLTDEIKKISKSCDKMDSHVDFIDKTYDNLKSPINFIKNKIDAISAISSISSFGMNLKSNIANPKSDADSGSGSGSDSSNNLSNPSTNSNPNSSNTPNSVKSYICEID